MRRLLAAAVFAMVLVGAAESCSGSGSSSQSPASTSVVPATQATMSAELVTRFGTRIARMIRPVLHDERRSCGGAQGIEQRDPALARTCKESLVQLSVLAKNFAVVLSNLRPPNEMQGLVADTGDEADAVTTVFRGYPVGECLPTPVPDNRGRCASAGRELAGVIAQWEKALNGWPQ
jgi:hypothetical protein